MTFWGVTTAYYDGGKTKASVVTSVEADQKPETRFRETPNADVYTDWFEDRDRAEAYARFCNTSAC